MVGYRGGSSLSYTLNAHSPWEGYRVAINGTEGRIELDVVERGDLASTAASAVLGSAGHKRPVVDPSAVTKEKPSGAGDLRPRGSRLLVQRHWEAARRVPIPEAEAAHGGGDLMLLDDLFRGPGADPLGRAAGYPDGVRSVLVGVSANTSLAEGRAVYLDEGSILG